MAPTPTIEMMHDELGAIDFETGKPIIAANRSCRREYALLGLVLVMTSLPYIALCIWNWRVGLAGISLLLLVYSFVAFASSAATGVSHHVRFLLAGSNPIGMSGAASMMLGAVDAILDWNEDRSFRHRQPIRYFSTALVKLITTPLGLVFFVCELLWDLVLLQRGWQFCRIKWREFFSVARFHSTICPEKSNDLFYADLAHARGDHNVFLYQWNRMRAMVFELQQYFQEAQDGVDDARTNIFRLDDLAVQNIFEELQLTRIERALDEHFDRDPAKFPLPQKLASRLLQNAKPLTHYRRMRRQLDEKVWSAPQTNGSDESARADRL